MWFHNSFPALRGLLNYNLNNSKNAIDGNKNKAMGLQAGRADMVFYWKGKAYHIEMKTPKGTQRPIQKVWQELVEQHGFNYFIVRSLDEFKDVISWITNDNNH